MKYGAIRIPNTKKKIINLLDFLALIFPFPLSRATERRAKEKTNAKYVSRAMYPATSL